MAEIFFKPLKTIASSCYELKICLITSEPLAKIPAESSEVLVLAQKNRLPSICRAIIAIPKLDFTGPQVYLDKQKVWQDGKLLSESEKIKKAYEDENYAYFLVQEGKYSFEEK